MSLVSAAEAELGADEFRAVAAILHDEARIALSEAKRTLVRSRLGRRLRARSLGSFAEYIRLVRSDVEERAEMVIALTTNHTHFFREQHHLDHLVADGLPALREAAERRPVRLWSAGCSSGEEVYSIAMALAGTSRTTGRWLLDRDVKLLATDISLPMVAAVTAGRYPTGSTRAVPRALAQAWLKPDGDNVVVAAELRSAVHARVLNLFGPWPIKRQFDVIFCRNVMIYFDEPAKRELEARLVDQLHPGGLLYIGHSERLGGSADQAMESLGHTIYRKKGQLP